MRVLRTLAGIAIATIGLILAIRNREFISIYSLMAVVGIVMAVLGFIDRGSDRATNNRTKE